MTTAKIMAGTLKANKQDRTITGLLLPFGEVGRTNLGKFSVVPDGVTLPADPKGVRLNVQHDDTRPVGTAVQLAKTPEGVVGTFGVLPTRDGDDLLAEVEAGVRNCLSAEVENVVIRNGQMVGGQLYGAAAVTQGAFPSATLVAADAGEYVETVTTDSTTTVETPYDTATTTEHRETTYEVKPDPEDEKEEEAEVAEDTTLAASAPADLRVQKGNTGKFQIASPNELFRALATVARTGDRRLMAALSDIVPADILGIEQPQFVNELWSGRAYQRKIVPLFNHADLTSFKVQGWRWVTKPVVAAYTGNKTAVPSNTVETEPVDVTAERIAGAHDIDRKFRDFKDEAFFAAYYKAMTESYAQVSDAAVLTDVLTAAGTAIEVGTVPSGVATGMAMIVDGALAVLGAANALPTFAVVATDLYRDILLTRNDDTLAYLNAALGLEDGTISTFRVVPDGSLTAGHVLVGAREAVTVHELGGESPIRVEAENIALGGIDAGVFGYYAVNVHDEDGLALVGPEVP